MTQKGLMSSLMLKPQLARCYESAHKKVFGKYYGFVHTKLHARFVEFEKDLWDLGIDPAHYADTVVSALKKWAVGKGYKTVPVNTFLGSYGFRVYLRIAESRSVEILPDNNSWDVYWAEALVLQSNIYANMDGTERLCDTVDRLRPLLSQCWLDLYDNGGYLPTMEIIPLLVARFGNLGTTKSLDDIISLIRSKNERQLHNQH